ncbi:MAG: DNA-processing protein DprA [Alphaproteobacteria bacterium]
MALADREIVDRIRLIRSESVGPVTYRELLQRYGGATEALASIADLSRRGGRTRPLRIGSVDDAARELDTAARAGARVIVHGTPDYPSLLHEIADAPPILFAVGHVGLLNGESVALVGARNASAVGMRFARDLAGDLGRQGIVIVSGLARGIDTAAHRGALASGTIAVLAGGLDNVYPAENEPLFRDICAQGCAISEMPFGTVPQARHFPRRNRIVSGLAKAVVVIEGAARSGSLITARLAAEQGRDVLAVPGSPLDPRARGPNTLIKQGAALCEGVEDVLAALSMPRRQDLHSRTVEEAAPLPIAADIDAIRSAIVANLSFAPIDIDDLARSCDAPSPLVATTLLELELAGRIERLPGHRVQLAA